MGFSIHILIDRTYGLMKLCLAYCSLKLLFCRLHKGRMESATDIEHKCTLGPKCLKLVASCVDSLDITTNYELAWTVVIGRYDKVVLV